ncbi:hypothetical protein [Saccharothrix syringae]|uniref:hypothetical protein n=1 Tax=Saccharothrix syringae TaxID=103733 RepID=UPI000525AD2F|nr:hypothetical protein [Saccharothrix syringae]
MRGDYPQALGHARRALHLIRDLDRPVQEADALNQAGRAAAVPGDYDTARDHCQAALRPVALYRTLGDTTAAADTLDRLGHPHAAPGRHDQAREMWRNPGTADHPQVHCGPNSGLLARQRTFHNLSRISRNVLTTPMV